MWECINRKYISHIPIYCKYTAYLLKFKNIKNYTNIPYKC